MAADLDSIAEPGGTMSSAAAFEASRAGHCSIIAATEAGKYVGVVVVSITPGNGGKVVDVDAAVMQPGRDRGREIEAIVRQVGQKNGCRWARAFSKRRGHLRHWKFWQTGYVYMGKI